MKIATSTKINTRTTRRLLFILVLVLAPQLLVAQATRGDGRLSLYYDARKESLEVQFRDARGRPIPSALKKIAQFLRSPDGGTHAIDIGLLDRVDALQDHFDEPVIEVISGYRSPDYNRGLKETGHAVANESLHLEGRAIDIHLDTVTEEAVRDFALAQKMGGVGWYPQNDFVHIDVGEIRQWGHAETRRKWVGLENNTGALTIRTTANRYFQNTPILVTISPAPNPSAWTLERFDRGDWKAALSGGGKSLSSADFRIPASQTRNLPRGRYRLRVAESLSNEFYLKKLK